MGNINSRLMKEAVECAFDQEVKRKQKCLSHCQLERWIIQELDKTSHPTGLGSLEKVMFRLFNIELVLVNDEPTTTDADKDLMHLKAVYAGHELYYADMGDGLKAMRWLDNDEENYVLITTPDGDGIPADMNAPVQFGLYNEDEKCLYLEYFDSSLEMFFNGHVALLLTK